MCLKQNLVTQGIILELFIKYIILRMSHSLYLLVEKVDAKI